MSAPPVIQTRELTRYYGHTVGVDGLDLEILPGEVFGFLGPNGAGKTTTIRLLLDLMRPTRGRCFLFGVPSRNPAIRAQVGYLPGELSLDGRMTGLQTLRFLGALNGGAGASSAEARDTLCEALGLSRGDLRRRVREYSRGMKQKLGLVAAFQHGPRLLILDEPTTGLDPLVREVVFQLMAQARDGGATVFHSSHVLSEVDRSCDRVGVLRGGRLMALLSVEEARKTAARVMVVDFQDEPSLEGLDRAGLERVGQEGGRLIFRVVGEMPGVLSFLARQSVQHMSFPEPRLEDAFDSLYRGSEERE